MQVSPYHGPWVPMSEKTEVAPDLIRLAFDSRHILAPYVRQDFITAWQCQGVRGVPVSPKQAWELTWAWWSFPLLPCCTDTGYGVLGTPLRLLLDFRLDHSAPPWGKAFCSPQKTFSDFPTNGISLMVCLFHGLGAAQRQPRPGLIKLSTSPFPIPMLRKGPAIQ